MKWDKQAAVTGGFGQNNFSSIRAEVGQGKKAWRKKELFPGRFDHGNNREEHVATLAIVVHEEPSDKTSIQEQESGSLSFPIFPFWMPFQNILTINDFTVCLTAYSNCTNIKLGLKQTLPEKVVSLVLFIPPDNPDWKEGEQGTFLPHKRKTLAEIFCFPLYNGWKDFMFLTSHRILSGWGDCCILWTLKRLGPRGW